MTTIRTMWSSTVFWSLAVVAAVTMASSAAVFGASSSGAAPSSGPGADPAVPALLIADSEQKLTALDGAGGDSFGQAVAISGDTAVVGAIKNDAGSPDAGAAYVFVRSGTTWTQQQKLTAADGGGGDFFGTTVAISGDTAVIGAHYNDAGSSDSGAPCVRLVGVSRDCIFHRGDEQRELSVGIFREISREDGRKGPGTWCFHKCNSPKGWDPQDNVVRVG